MDVDRAVVLAMADAARWAPSVHNSQPWRLRSRSDGLEVLVDPDRSLPVLDADGRLRTLSCGAAAAAAACASTALGLATRTALLPDGPRGDTVARLVCVARRTPTGADRRLADAVPRRRTHPAVHPDEPVPGPLLEDLAVTVEDEGVTMTVLDRGGRAALVGLVGRAVDEHRRRADLLAETGGWVRTPVPAAVRSVRPVDGVLRASLATWPVPEAALLAPRPGPGSRADQPPGTGPGRSGGPVVDDATVVLLSTPGDTRRDRLVAGIALERLLLHATALDLVAAFCDLATQLATTRPLVGGLLPRPGRVQVALRLGRALVDVRTPPRRPLADVLDR